MVPAMNAPVFLQQRFVEEYQYSVAVVVLDGVSLTTVAAATEPFHLVNRMLSRDRFRLQFVSPPGEDPITQTGIPIPCSTSMAEICHGPTNMRPDIVVVCGGQQTNVEPTLERFLRCLMRWRCRTFVIGDAVAVAGKVGLVRGESCAVHWSSIAALNEQHPDLEFKRMLFSSGSHVATCAGEFAVFDMIVNYIEDVCGPEIGAEVCNHFLAHGKRSGSTEQILTGDALICDDEKFHQAIKIMAENIEEPVTSAEIADRLGVSPRQVQRIFANNGFESPLKYYQNLRLNRAQQLIEQTRMSLTEVGIACGFEKLSAFNKCFKRRFGVTPREMRNCSGSKRILVTAA